MTDVSPITGRPYGKPGSRVRARIAKADEETLKLFPSPRMRAYYLANLVEAQSCWPRVLDGTMEQDRFHERVGRMQEAIFVSVGFNDVH